MNFVINLEESSEPSTYDGDGYTEAGLIECPSDFTDGGRDLCSESMFEYGSRVGFWRVLKVTIRCLKTRQNHNDFTGIPEARPHCHGHSMRLGARALARHCDCH